MREAQDQEDGRPGRSKEPLKLSCVKPFLGGWVRRGSLLSCRLGAFLPVEAMKGTRRREVPGPWLLRTGSPSHGPSYLRSVKGSCLSTCAQ